MSNLTAIEFAGVSKSFQRHRGRVLLSNHIKGWFGQRDRTPPFCALKNITFRLERGESLAIVGTNGAGKSTLLSLVAGLSQPDRGQVVVNGRLNALLELASGFHPDLTGTENVRLNASLLGLTRERTHQLFDSIVQFSGIGDFIDEPLRTYSTGMVMRLAFSVAINMEPEILIVDEVLAVGDQAFQVKCIEKIFEFKHAGRTLLFVSHSAAMIQQLCDRALWLDHGELIMDGRIRDVVEAYEGRLITPQQS